MRILTFLIAGFAISAMAFSAAKAADYEFSTSIAAPDVKIASITVNISDDVKNEKVRWGPRDIEQLKKTLIKKVTSRLKRNELMGDNGARLELTLIDITPNRPTMHELSKRTGLDFVSFGLGGAEVKAHLVAADGTDLGDMRYRYFADYLYDYSSGMTTWYDARRAFDKFSRRLVKELKAEPAS
jgi:hypothetical protein